MTSVDHKSGTDRCYEAYCKVGSGYDVVVNIQGDEPFIQRSQLEAVKACFDDASTQIATLVKPFTPADGFDALENVNSPKVVVNKEMKALYFSRSIIPYQRNRDKKEWLAGHTYYKTYRTLCLPRAGVEGDYISSAVVARTGRIVGAVALAGERLFHQGGHQRSGDHWY